MAERSSHLAAALALAATGRDEPLPHAGDVIHDRYRIERTIGSGGMGTVYEVTRIEDGARFALKVATKVRGEAQARLAREAQMAATAHHPNLVSVIDVDVAPSGVLYLVMELVEGESVRHLVSRYGDKPWALEVLRQLANGLLALHGVGVIHRDLKPANVLLSTDANGKACVKIVDFGIARISDNDSGGHDAGEKSVPTVAASAAQPAVAGGDPEVGRETVTMQAPPAPRRRVERLTETGKVPGTPAYIAPEFGRLPAELTPAADIYAFGIIAYELLTGKRPFVRPQLSMVIAGRPLEKVPSLVTQWPDAPVALARVLQACIAPDPDQRPSSADLVALLARDAA
jgi:serine/threonine-protein kinase